MSKIPTELVKSWDAKQGIVRTVRFNVDGNYCMTAGGDKTVKLWNPYRQMCLNTYTGCGSELLDVCSACDNANILAGGRDCQPTLFDVESGKMLKRWRSHGGPVNAVAFNEDSRVAISASQDGCVNLHDVRSRGAPFQVLNEATDAVLCLDVGAYEIATGSADGHVRLYDIREGRLFVDFMNDAVVDVHLSPDNQSLLVAAIGSPLRLIEKANGKLLSDYSGHENTNYQIRCGIFASGNEIVSGSENGYVYIWDFVDNTKVLAKLDHGVAAKYVHSVSTHPTHQCLLSAAGGRVYYWHCFNDEEEDQ